MNTYIKLHYLLKIYELNLANYISLSLINLYEK